MKTFKGNHNIEAAFANFIEVVEQETGIKITDVSCWSHRPDDNTVTSALALNSEIGDTVGGTTPIKVANEHLIWGLATLELTVFATEDHAHLIEEEDPFVKCAECEDDVAEDETDTRFTEHMCRECGEKQMAEWVKEEQEQITQYQNDRI